MSRRLAYPSKTWAPWRWGPSYGQWTWYIHILAQHLAWNGNLVRFAVIDLSFTSAFKGFLPLVEEDSTPVWIQVISQGAYTVWGRVFWHWGFYTQTATHFPHSCSFLIQPQKEVSTAKLQWPIALIFMLVTFSLLLLQNTGLHVASETSSLVSPISLDWINRLI